MLEVKGLVAQYGDFRLEEINLTIRDGECLALVGPTGAGKTLLLESLLGIKSPLEGKVLLDTKDIALIPIEERKFSYLPQDLALFPHLSVRNNIG
ncbi:ATP-binding cassette domain-containing protein, partial [Planctomycetota bacterium]